MIMRLNTSITVSGVPLPVQSLWTSLNLRRHLTGLSRYSLRRLSMEWSYSFYKGTPHHHIFPTGNDETDKLILTVFLRIIPLLFTVYLRLTLKYFCEFLSFLSPVRRVLCTFFTLQKNLKDSYSFKTYLYTIIFFLIGVNRVFLKRDVY